MSVLFVVTKARTFAFFRPTKRTHGPISPKVNPPAYSNKPLDYMS